MTQILSFLTDSHVFQISDRLISARHANGRFVPQKDEQNKAVVWQRRAIFSHTGLAKLHGVPVSLWLARALLAANTDSLSAACEAVRVAATDAFWRLPLPAEDKRTSFIVVGFTNPNGAGQWGPIGIEISNCLGPKGSFLSKAKATFETRFQLLPPGCIWFIGAGRPGRVSASFWNALCADALNVG
jgi:hypothetical protein